MTMKRLLYIIALALVVTLCPAWGIPPRGDGRGAFTLDECIAIALANNNQMRLQQNQYAQQEIAYKQARANLLPYVSGSVGQSWVFGRSTGNDNISRSQNSAQTSFSVSASLLLWDGLKMKFAIDEAKAAMQAEAANVETVEAEIRLNISVIYLQVLLNRELLAVATTQYEDTQRKVERAEALVAANRLAQGEVYSLQAQAAKEELAKIQAESTLKLSLLDLAQAMELEDFTGFDIALPTEDELAGELLPSNEEVYQQALQNRPEIRAAELQLAANESALKSAKASYSPTISAGANLGTGYYNISGYENDKFGKQLGDNLSTSVGLSLNIPLFTQMNTTNNLRRTKLNIENAKLQIEQVKKDLRKEIDQAYYNALAAQARQYSALKAERSAAEAYRYEEQKYKAGRSTSYTYYEAKNLYVQSQSERLQSQYDYLFKLKVLQYYKGE